VDERNVFRFGILRRDVNNQIPVMTESPIISDATRQSGSLFSSKSSGLNT
jgi:hypothetical protein